ncbi:MAG: hypothetical protein HQ511_03425, partial [Rhodospirillales bacterium]|nr:hypothetical protein [Rhodospirillales bacterium]
TQQSQIAAQQVQIQMLSRQVQQLVGAGQAPERTAATVPVAPGRGAAEISPAQRALEKPKADVAKTAHRTPAPVASGGTKASLSLSGQVNRAGLFYNDGATSDLRSVDNDNSSTRIRLKGKVSPSDDLTVGSTIEVEIESNSSRSITQDDNKSVQDTSNDGTRNTSHVNFSERTIEVYVDSKKFGKLSLGQGSTASDKTAEADLSGTKVVASSDIKDVGGDLFFARRDGTFSTVAVDTVFRNMDGMSRADRIRYDTPSYQGLRASTSLSDGGAWDAALHYGQKLFTFNIKAAAGYANMASISSSVETQFSGSLSVRHNSGLSFTVAGAVQDMSGAANDRDPRFVYGKLGYKAKLLKFGHTALSADYGASWDQSVNGAEGDSMAIAVVQNVTDWGTELYAGFRRLKLDYPGLSLDEIDTVLAGARVKF